MAWILQAHERTRGAEGADWPIGPDGPLTRGLLLDVTVGGPPEAGSLAWRPAPLAGADPRVVWVAYRARQLGRWMG